MDRKTITDIYVRTCLDSGFKMTAPAAATFAAKLLAIHPLDVWIAVGDFGHMMRIADGTHPAVRKPTTEATP